MNCTYTPQVTFFNELYCAYKQVGLNRTPMTINELSAFEVLRDYYNNDLPTSLALYREYLDDLISINEALKEAKVKATESELYSETLLLKFYLHSLTLAQSLDGTILKSKFNQNGRLLDLPSIYVVLRAQFESYLMFMHIYRNGKSEDDEQLRFYAWIYSALLERQGFPALHDESKIQKEKDKTELLRFQELIEGLDAFNDLTPKQQSSLIRTGSKKLFKHWDKIMKESGIIPGTLLYPYYNYISSYAHSEGLSVIQLKESGVSYSPNNTLAKLALFLSTLLVCSYMQNLAARFKAVEIKFNTIQSIRLGKIQFYAKMIGHNVTG